MKEIKSSPLLTPRLLEAQDINIGLGSSFNKLDRLRMESIALSRDWGSRLQHNGILNSGYLKV